MLGHKVFVVTGDFGDEDLDSPFSGGTGALFRAEACVALNTTSDELGTELR